jgi:transcriptional regulator EpsA
MNFLPSALDGNIELYLRIIREGIAVRSHYDLLKWLQGDVQHYLPHKIMLAVWAGPNANQVEYDVVSALPGVRTGFLHSQRLLIFQRELHRLWVASGNTPYKQSLERCEQRCSPCAIRKAFYGMRSLLVHGICDERTGQDCLYVILGANDAFDDVALSVMEILVPYLDTALRRIAPVTPQHRSEFAPAKAPQHIKNCGLSEREAEILDWVRLGKTNGEIAAILGISAWTVKNHLQSVFRKLDVFNRVQAIAKVYPAPVVTNSTAWFSPAIAPLGAKSSNVAQFLPSIKC